MHCFAGCTVQDVAAAIGLTMADLFPPTDKPRRSPPAPGVTHTALKAAAEFERQVLKIVRFDRAKGRVVSEVDRGREQLAKQRIELAQRSR